MTDAMTMTLRAVLEDKLARRRIDLHLAKIGTRSDGRRFTPQDLDDIEADIVQLEREIKELL